MGANPMIIKVMAVLFDKMVCSRNKKTPTAMNDAIHKTITIKNNKYLTNLKNIQRTEVFFWGGVSEDGSF